MPPIRHCMLKLLYNFQIYADVLLLASLTREKTKFPMFQHMAERIG